MWFQMFHICLTRMCVFVCVLVSSILVFYWSASGDNGGIIGNYILPSVQSFNSICIFLVITLCQIFDLKYVFVVFCPRSLAFLTTQELFSVVNIECYHTWCQWTGSEHWERGSEQLTRCKCRGALIVPPSDQTWPVPHSSYCQSLVLCHSQYSESHPEH